MEQLRLPRATGVHVRARQTMGAHGRQARGARGRPRGRRAGQRPTQRRGRPSWRSPRQTSRPSQGVGGVGGGLPPVDELLGGRGGGRGPAALGTIPLGMGGGRPGPGARDRTRKQRSTRAHGDGDRRRRSSAEPGKTSRATWTTTRRRPNMSTPRWAHSRTAYGKKYKCTQVHVSATFSPREDS